MGSLAPKPPLRKLVSARCISQIKPLNSSETHEVVVVDSWPVVVPKGQFAVNELILYFEIDSFLPFDEERYGPYRFSHTSAKLHGEKGWVVQTVELAGHISQGMVFRIDDEFPEVERIRDRIAEYEIDDCWDPEGEDSSRVDMCLKTKDLTDELRVKKWRAFHRLDGGLDLGQPPSFLLDMRLERAQNLRSLWETHGDTEFEITEMLDGMPITVYRVNEDGGAYRKLPGMLRSDRNFHKRSGFGISIGSHDYGETCTSMSWSLMKRLSVFHDLTSLSPSEVVLGGVLCGMGISGNPHQIRGRWFFTHSISDPGSMKRLGLEEACEWQIHNLGVRIRPVPIFSRQSRSPASETQGACFQGGGWVSQFQGDLE